MDKFWIIERLSDGKRIELVAIRLDGDPGKRCSLLKSMVRMECNSECIN